MAKNMLYDNMDASQQQTVNKLSVAQEPVTPPEFMLISSNNTPFAVI
jgi:hypothetical protein